MIKLTWHAARSCWKKQKNGRTYYLGCGKCKSKSDKDGRKAAETEWEDILRKLDGKPKPSPENALARLGQLVSEIDGIDANSLMAAVASQMAVSQKLPEPKSSESLSVTDAVCKYLAEKRAECLAGSRCPGNYQDHKSKLQTFLGVAAYSGISDINDVSAEFLSSYRAAQLALLDPNNPNKRAAGTIRARLHYVKTFLTWAYEQELIEYLPRNVASYNKVYVPKPVPEFYTIDEVRILYKAATPLLKACILLALNCGFTQADISSLEWEHIDTRTRLLQKYRTKTAKATRSQLKSSYRLWPLTLETLRDVSKTTTGIILKSPRGRILRSNKLTKLGNESKHDVIRIAFSELAKQCPKQTRNKTFKHFRKTSANLVAQHYQKTPHVRDLFLGHSIQGMSIHYADEYFDLVHEACDTLGKLYSLEK